MCIVIDLFLRKIIGYAIRGRINRHLVIAAVSCIQKQRLPLKCSFPSDQGSQYTSKDVRKLLDELHFIVNQLE